MLKVVSNTTPLISLLKLDRLDLLQSLYGQINIPEAVYKEIEAGKSKGFYQDLSQIDWINIIQIKNELAVKYFIDLDAGEAEAIVLATELSADLIVLDEKLGRLHAKHADLKVTRTLGILTKAKIQGLVPELKPLLNELIEKGIWISERLKAEVLFKVEEQ